MYLIVYVQIKKQTNQHALMFIDFPTTAWVVRRLSYWEQAREALI